MELDNYRVNAANSTLAGLLPAMETDPRGKFSPSVYETGRLVRLTPSLSGHRRRIRFLLDTQHSDGTWGGPEDYALVPTLSATEALLAHLRQRSSPPHSETPSYPEIRTSAQRGLTALFRRLRAADTVSLPDTVAVEIIVPGLIEQINARLDSAEQGKLNSGPSHWGPFDTGPFDTARRLVPPPSTKPEMLTKLRGAVRHQQAIPTKLLHSLEAMSPFTSAPLAEPTAGGVGCSPAATAAWLGDDTVRANRHPSIRYLESTQVPSTGAVPVAAPLAPFERAWVLSTLAGLGLLRSVPPRLITELHAAFGEFGVAGGAGLPPDADDTATALHALALLGSPRSPDCLWAYQADDHFDCFPGESTPSSTTNAHVLEAFGACLSRDSPRRHRDAIGTISEWLSGCQAADGSWSDKWHASPYYATVRCALALDEYGTDSGTDAVGKAVKWVLDTQRGDGSWGRWQGTAEETAYAMQILLRTRVGRANEAVVPAAARGCAFLLGSTEGEGDPPMWHDKDLYTPIRIVRAEKLAAMYSAYADPRVAERVARNPIAGTP